MATNSFLSGGGDYQKIVYDKVPKSKIQYFQGILIRDSIVEYLEQNPVVRPEDYYSETNKRIEIIEPPVKKVGIFLPAPNPEIPTLEAYRPLFEGSAFLGMLSISF